MVVCPVCEHAQDHGGECSVCGKRLTQASAPAEATARIDALEPTGFASSPAPAPEPLPDLEQTVREPVATPVLEDAAPWIERTAREPVPAVSVEPLEVERAAAPKEAAPALDLLALAVCRYCRTPATPGEAFCPRCGLKLSVQRARQPEASPPAPGRCRHCGASVPGDVCPSCGARLPREA